VLACCSRLIRDVDVDAISIKELSSKSNSPAPINHYATLGVSLEATPKEVTSAYRHLALVYHPDKAGSSTKRAGAELLFKMLSAAHRVLSTGSCPEAHQWQEQLMHQYSDLYA
jgi:preprotein translocase subunit Sec63